MSLGVPAGRAIVVTGCVAKAVGNAVAKIPKIKILTITGITQYALIVSKNYVKIIFKSIILYEIHKS